MSYKRKVKRRKKNLKPKKYTVTISRKQLELIRLHCAYTNSTPPHVLKQAIGLYLKQVSHDLNQWKKISPTSAFLCEEDKAKQMELVF
jgi:hypothetical protein